MEDVVTIKCYGTTKTYERQKALDKFFEGMMMCEGAERDRYTNIFIALKCGEKNIDGDA